VGSVGRGDGAGEDITGLMLGKDTLDGSMNEMDWAEVRERGESKWSREGDVGGRVERWTRERRDS